MIIKGAREHQGGEIAVTTVLSGRIEASPVPVLFENEEGSAL